MTLLALDTEREARGAVLVDRRRQSLKMSCVAFQASRDDGPVKVGEAISITGAVHPTERRPVRDWQLEELIFVPVQVGLTLLARPNDESNALGTRVRVRRRACNSGLNKAVLLPFPLLLFHVLHVHPEVEIRIRGLQDVVARRKATKNGIAAGRHRCQVVCGLVIRGELVCMT